VAFAFPLNLFVRNWHKVFCFKVEFKYSFFLFHYTYDVPTIFTVLISKKVRRIKSKVLAILAKALFLDLNLVRFRVNIFSSSKLVELIYEN